MKSYTRTRPSIFAMDCRCMRERRAPQPRLCSRQCLPFVSASNREARRVTYVTLQATGHPNMDAAARNSPEKEAPAGPEQFAGDDDRIVLPDAVKAPVMIRRRTLLERAAAADQLPRELATRAARQ